jgi:phosphoglycerate dehydrogenase-like enzyme
MTGRPLFVVVSAPHIRTMTPEALDILRAAGEVEHLDLTGLERIAALRAVETIATDATALLFAPWGSLGFAGLAPACWELMPSLRVISGTFDNRFEEPRLFGQTLAEMQARRITVVDTSRTMTPLVAEFALLMMLNLLRGVPEAVAAVRRGEFPLVDSWDYEQGFVAGDLSERSVGLAGFGVINRRLSELLRPFSCSVAAYDPYLEDDAFDSLGVRRAESLTALAESSEIFVVGIPPTSATIGIIDREVIGALPRGSLFVLVTRMAVVEQGALWKRTAAGEIRAAVDVFDPEPPPPDAPFRTDRNVIPTPHLAGNTAEAHRRCFHAACEEAVKVVAGGRSVFEMNRRDAAVYAGRPPCPREGSNLRPSV